MAIFPTTLFIEAVSPQTNPFFETRIGYCGLQVASSSDFSSLDTPFRVALQSRGHCSSAHVDGRRSSGGCPNTRRCRRQWNDLNSHSFLGNDSHDAATGVAEPKILALVRSSTGAALRVAFNFRYEYPAVTKAAKLRGARGIRTFIKHRSLH